MKTRKTFTYLAVFIMLLTLSPYFAFAQSGLKHTKTGLPGASNILVGSGKR